jgi:hypothetical protein
MCSDSEDHVQIATERSNAGMQAVDREQGQGEMKIHVIGAAILTALLFGAFVWPTPYYTERTWIHSGDQAYDYRIKINRFTGEAARAEVLGLRGWTTVYPVRRTWPDAEPERRPEQIDHVEW